MTEKELDRFRETETRSLEVERITEREREVVLLSVLFFGAKRDRLKIARGQQRVVEPEPKPGDPNWLTFMKWAFAQAREEFSDIEGDIVGFVTENVLRSPKRAEFFPLLSDQNIRFVCEELDDIFENQEFCAQCEAWSHYEIEPEEFPIVVAADMLWLCARDLGIPEVYKWADYGGKKRASLVKKIIRSYSSKPSFRELLAPSEQDQRQP